MTISTLHPYYEYAIKVAAATVGVGPFSALLHLTTLEDGRLCRCYTGEVRY